MSDNSSLEIFPSSELEQLTAVKPLDVRVAAMDLLARREHTLRELRRKLQRRFADAAIVEAELQRLADENLQSDRRFAATFVRQRAARGKGPLRLRQEMRERGLSDSNIEDAMTDTEVDWHTVAEQVLHKKFGLDPPSDIKEKARRGRFMQYRGFSGDHFFHLL
jgi:regulatory protein